MGSGDDLLSNDFAAGSMEHGVTVADDLCHVFPLRVANAIVHQSDAAASHSGDDLAKPARAGPVGDRRHASAEPTGPH